VTPRLALRIGILSVAVLVVFGALFLRLWSLQVLSGSKYVDQAQSNSYRTWACRRRAAHPRSQRHAGELVECSSRYCPIRLVADGRHDHRDQRSPRRDLIPREIS